MPTTGSRGHAMAGKSAVDQDYSETSKASLVSQNGNITPCNGRQCFDESASNGADHTTQRRCQRFPARMKTTPCGASATRAPTSIMQAQHQKDPDLFLMYGPLWHAQLGLSQQLLLAARFGRRYPPHHRKRAALSGWRLVPGSLVASVRRLDRHGRHSHKSNTSMQSAR